MKHLKSEFEKLKKRKLFLIIDYDGTLTEIAATPEKAVLKKETRQTLEKLLQKHKIAILSGRSINDVRRLVGIKRIYYGGNHGLEIVGPNFKYVHPKAFRLKPTMKGIHEESKKSLKNVRGAILEFKGLSVSFHYRMVSKEQMPEFKSKIKKILEKWSQKKNIAVRSGKKVIEILPNVDWDKGKAALLLLRKIDPKHKFFPVGLGDDRTDEDLFSSLSTKGTTVLISPRPKKSKAKYYLKNPYEVREFLEELVDTLKFDIT